MSIREEIDNVRSYLQIQEMFHDYSFTVKMDVAEDILDYRTLNLILQPLVPKMRLYMELTGGAAVSPA